MNARVWRFFIVIGMGIISPLLLAVYAQEALLVVLSLFVLYLFLITVKILLQLATSDVMRVWGSVLMLILICLGCIMAFNLFFP